MQGPRKHEVQVNTTIAAAGNSGQLPNLGLSAMPDVIIAIAVKGTPTGTNPTLQFTLYAVDHAGNKYQIWQGANITAAGVQRAQVSGCIDPFFEVDWATGGTSPSFPNVYVTLYMSSPDL